MNQKVKEALLQMDPENDSQWTADGLPRLDVMKELAGEDVTRMDIQSVSKTFSRKNPVIEDAPEGVPNTVVKNEPTESPQTREDTKVSESDAEVERTYKEVRQRLHDVQKEFREAQMNMDEVIRRREREASQVTFAESVKKYQESQRKAREARSQNRR